MKRIFRVVGSKVVMSSHGSVLDIRGKGVAYLSSGTRENGVEDGEDDGDLSASNLSHHRERQFVP